MQDHKHRATCKKYRCNKNVCRFGFPRCPMPETLILEPYITNDPIIYENYKKIRNDLVRRVKLNKLDCDFTTFLFSLDLQIVKLDDTNESITNETKTKYDLLYEQYKIAIRSSLKKAAVFLVRSLSEVNINNYNPMILYLFQSNMDIQFILHVFAIISYILNYINKSEKGFN